MPVDPTQSNTPSKHPKASSAADDWNAPDPLWNLLDTANKPQENVFFARDVVRKTRFLKQERTSLIGRLADLLTAPRLAIGAMACGAVLLITQLFVPSTVLPQGTAHLDQPTPAPDTPVMSTSGETHLSEIVMLDTLSAAADDPSIFTHDEVLAMLDL